MSSNPTIAGKVAVWALAFAVGVIASSMASAQVEPKFEGLPIRVEFVEDGRNVKLLSPLAFIGPNGRRWDAPTGTETDGASIPKWAWSVIGGPFEGKYRNAAIIHDRYCETRTRKWEDTHEAFYHAMLVAGVGKTKAKIMYAAVNKAGPRWPEPKPNPMCIGPDGKADFTKCTENNAFERTPKYYPAMTAADVEKFIDEIRGEADPEDITALRKALQ